MEGKMRKFLLCLALASIAIGAVALPAHAATKKVFNSVPAQLPGNVASVGFEATQTDGFGDEIRLAPGTRKLKKVAIVMSSWACETGSWTAGCDTTQGATFNETIKLTLYRVNTGDPNLPGAVLASRKRTFAIPFRPSADPTDCSANPTRWYSPEDDACYNGKAFKIVFEFSGLKLPNELVYEVSYNTSTSGDQPHGTRPCQSTVEGCPDDSLNVGAEAGLPARGSDVYPDGVFVDQQTGGDCATDATVSDEFSLDACNWHGFNPLVAFKVKA
jgi:hypothetical protein